jgi:hypothetical protein
MGAWLAAGYTGRVLDMSPICYSDPGMTNANMQFAVLDVDADAPENTSVNPDLEVSSYTCGMAATGYCLQLFLVTEVQLACNEEAF